MRTTVHAAALIVAMAALTYAWAAAWSGYVPDLAWLRGPFC